MSEPAPFLHAVAQALSTMTLYAPGHPASVGVVEDAFQELHRLQADTPRVAFSFLRDTVVYGDSAVHDLRNWPWTSRLAAAGIQRLEISEAVTLDGFRAFLDEVLARFSRGAPADEPSAERPGIRWGPVGVRSEGPMPDWQALPLARIAYRLGEEADVVKWVYERAALDGDVPRDEVETVVASLGVAMQGDLPFLLPVLQLTDQDQYRTMHALNVSLLTMSLAESLGMGSQDVHAFGTAGLLHDIGITRVPAEILAKPVLDAGDRRVMELHPEAGARMLLARRGAFDLAAVVAYEHHMRPDGTGYPRLPSPRELHYASRIVSLCDVYDALRTARLHRAAWEPQHALGYIEEGAGTLFDPGLARAFVAMLRKLEPRPAASAGS